MGNSIVPHNRYSKGYIARKRDMAMTIDESELAEKIDERIDRALRKMPNRSGYGRKFSYSVPINEGSEWNLLKDRMRNKYKGWKTRWKDRLDPSAEQRDTDLTIFHEYIESLKNDRSIWNKCSWELCDLIVKVCKILDKSQNGSYGRRRTYDYPAEGKNYLTNIYDLISNFIENNYSDRYDIPIAKEMYLKFSNIYNSMPDIYIN